MAVFVIYIFYIYLLYRYGGVESIRIHPRLMWTPDLLLYNRFCFYNILDIFKKFFKSKDVLLIALLHKSILFSFIPLGSIWAEHNWKQKELFSPISPFSFMVGMHNIICHWALYVEKLCGLERQIVAAEPQFNLELFWIYNNLSIRVTQCKRRTFPRAKFITSARIHTCP